MHFCHWALEIYGGGLEVWLTDNNWGQFPLSENKTLKLDGFKATWVIVIANFPNQVFCVGSLSLWQLPKIECYDGCLPLNLVTIYYTQIRQSTLNRTHFLYLWSGVSLSEGRETEVVGHITLNRWDNLSFTHWPQIIQSLSSLLKLVR